MVINWLHFISKFCGSQKGSCKVLLSDTHTHQRDSPRFHFIYKKWIQTTFTIKGYLSYLPYQLINKFFLEWYLLIVIVSGVAEGDVPGSFIVKDRSHSPTDHTTTIKAAKYSIALQYLVFHGLVEEDQLQYIQNWLIHVTVTYILLFHLTIDWTPMPSTSVKSWVMWHRLIIKCRTTWPGIPAAECMCIYYLYTFNKKYLWILKFIWYLAR